ANIDKSFVRVTKADGKKLGGGSRVKKIVISDKWSEMSGNMNTSTANYGYAYDYTTMLDGEPISSGVASYEPSVGADENPMRQPVPYVQKIKGALNNLFSLEEPFGESFFPGASVGYSKVTVRDLDEFGNPDPNRKTGYTVNEYYTAKDFPVQLKSLTIKPQQTGPSGWYSLFGSYSLHELTFSQGYSIELNDMHGKPKAVRVFNQTGSEISSTVYEYNTEPLNAGEMRLKNVVKVVNEDGTIEHKIIGREIEVFTDMREQESKSTGQTIMIGGDVFPLPFFGVPGGLPHWPKKQNDDIKLFRSASTVKVVQYYGIVEKVIQTDDGTSSVMRNIAYDGLTGEVLVSSNQNEFDKPVYNVSVPAYFMYNGMSGAYKNAGTVISSFTTNGSGELSNSGTINSFMHPGDELINVTNGNRYWIVETSVNGSTSLPKTKKLIDRTGMVAPWFSGTVRIVRSGYRNMIMTSGANFMCLGNPISPAHKLEFSSAADLTALKVLTASASVYDENWGVKPDCATCPPGYKLSPDGQYCDLIPFENTSYCFTFCRGAIDTDGNYGYNGAQIQETSSSTPVSRLSHFWGGNCGTCTRVAGSPAHVTDRDSAMKVHEEVSEGSAESMLIPTDACTRSDYGENFPCGAGLCGRLATAGIWLCLGTSSNISAPVNEWIGFETCLDITTAKNYYIGYAVDNNMRIYIDGVLWKSLTGANINNFRYWYVSPYFLSAGHHTLRVEFQNTGGPGTAAVEVYNNTFAELTNPSFGTANANIIFSTARDITGKPVQAYRDIHNGPFNFSRIARYTCAGGSLPNVCNNVGCGRIPVNRVVNPYVKGYAGNWRAKDAKEYQVNRKYTDVFNPNQKGMDIKNAGYFELFRTFWYYNNTVNKWQETEPLSKEWISSNSITLYDKYGQANESKDALGIYSAATFAYRGEKPLTVILNSRNREVYYDGFEEYRFRLGCPVTDSSCYTPLFTAKAPNTPYLGNYIATVEMHTGNYSLAIPGLGIQLTTTAHTKEHKQEDYLAIDGSGQYITKQVPGLYPLGFEPTPTGKYLLSAWIKDGQPTTTTAGLSLSVNGVSIPVTRKATVEKWKQVEAVIDMNSIPLSNGQVTFLLQSTGGFTTFLDDLRIHPLEGHMKSHAYDDKTLRLMATMDENNFATFYEYDDEGALIRTKKETERGIITVKESRASFKKRQ
ncbi:MAG TPA: hypothetical protein VD996_04655, partial [Chitinophagaceae bacterium]|nr:hypothetical protein [Chitinophagaceae bacterium]